MHFENRRPDQSEERILPLINVVFLLLIFFMIAGTLSVTEPFDIKPTHSDTEAQVATDTLRILLGHQGQLALQEKTVTEVFLLTEVGKKIASNPSTRVQLKADGRVAGNKVVQLMERLREAGVEKLQLLTTPENM
ncbi:MAG TPA: biopolymer transporter ExbD [Cellvibrionaceae bacterium]